MEIISFYAKYHSAALEIALQIVKRDSWETLVKLALDRRFHIKNANDQSAFTFVYASSENQQRLQLNVSNLSVSSEEGLVRW